MSRRESMDASAGGLLLCCPVCGRVRLLVSASEGGGEESVEWECRECGATGLMSSLRPGGAAVVLGGLPAGSYSLRPPARPVGDLYVPMFRPVEDSLGAWAEAGAGVPVRLVCAASGVGVGTLTCEGGVWIARAWFGGREARLLMAEDSTDVAAFCSEGCAGILPVGCFVAAERPPEGWPVGWLG